VEYGRNQKIEGNEIIIKNNNGEIKVEFLKDLDGLEISEIIPETLSDIVSQNFKKENAPIINSALATIPIKWGDFFKNISSYDFDPKFCKNINATGNEKLTKHGGSLPVVLKNILNDENDKKEFLIYYTNMLPYIKEVSVEKVLDEERIFMIVEKYNDVKIPAPFISDGTSTIMAILVALYFQEGEIILVEEPERHIHPSLINQLMLMMESVDKQVIITTHSPELLKYSELKDILFISRDNNGFSDIKRIIDNDLVKPFIEELGVDSVFVNDYLGLE
jgi:AAA15 family ATPase/GTPase